MSLRDLFSRVKPCPDIYKYHIMEPITFEDCSEEDLRVLKINESVGRKYLDEIYMKEQKFLKKNAEYEHLLEQNKRGCRFTTYKDGVPGETYTCSHALSVEKRTDCLIITTDLTIPELKKTEHYFDKERHCHIYVFKFKEVEDLYNNPDFATYLIYTGTANKTWPINQRINGASCARSKKDLERYGKVAQAVCRREGLI